MGIPAGEVPAHTPDPTGEIAEHAHDAFTHFHALYHGPEVAAYLEARNREIAEKVAARTQSTTPSVAVAEYLLDHVVAKPEDIQALGRE